MGSRSAVVWRFDGSVLQRERREVRTPVVPVLVLLALQPADDRVGHRREDDLDGDLERPVEGDDLHHRPGLPGPEEGNRIEEGAVDELADRGRADRAGPEMTPLGPDLHLRHDIAVHEVAAPEGDDRRDDNPPRAPEDDLQGRLDHGIEGLLRIRRHVDHEEPHDGREDHRDEARPDDFARARVAIDLGQHVAEDVGDREEEVPGAEGQAEEDARLARPDQVRAEQHRHETHHDEVVVAVVAGVRDEFMLERFGVDGHLRARFLSVCGSICPVQASPVRDPAPDPAQARDSPASAGSPASRARSGSLPRPAGLRIAGIAREVDQPLRNRKFKRPFGLARNVPKTSLRVLEPNNV